MKPAIVALATGVIASVGVVAAPAASADTPGCVSRHEYRIVNNDPPGPYVSRTKAQVERLFDTHGWAISKRPNRHLKVYPACPGAPTATSVCIRYYYAGHWFLNQRYRCAGD